MKSIREFLNRAFWAAALTCVCAANAGINDFESGRAAYERGDFGSAAAVFQKSASERPAAGAFQNLGNAHWQMQRPAQAILAWERALTLDPFDSNSKNNLRFARETAQLESPELTWYEFASSWLPAGAWAWIGCSSFWFAISMMIVPQILRRRKTATQQALAALGLGIFLLSIPANYGVFTRSKQGFVLSNETGIKFTPTKDGEPITRLAAGEPGRILRERNGHLLIRTRRFTGWIEADRFELIAPK